MAYDYQTADTASYSLLKEYAKENRKHPTLAESVLWEYLRYSQLGVPFKRQHIVGIYIADFICITAHLIIEVDGKYHELPQQQIDDVERQRWLEEQGFDVIRFTNEEILQDTENVLKRIEQKISTYHHGK